MDESRFDSPSAATIRRVIATIALVVAVASGLAVTAEAQAVRLYYQEVARDGRIYVFNTPEAFKKFQATGEIGTNITLTGAGPNGETVIAENDTALDLFNFKHNLPAYDRPTPPPPAPASGLPKTAIGGRLYADFSSKGIKDEGTGVKSSDSGTGVDVKRFYFTASHQFDETWSAQFQSDIGDVGTKRYDVFVKKAFLQAKLDDAAIFRLGSADTPWVPFVEGVYGQRFLENTLTDALGFGTSADWGIHLLGKAADNVLSYQFSVVNGKGYSSPARTRSVDLEGRVSLEPVKGLTLAIGGYSGKRGNDTDAAPAKHTASRLDALVNYADGPVRVGGEYFTADNWSRVTQTTTDRSDGYSGWLQFMVGKRWTLFGRYDSAKPSKDLNPKLEFTYYNLGVQWKPAKPVVAALAYKYADVKGGPLGTSNGTIGSTKAGHEGKYNEVGLWFSYDF